MPWAQSGLERSHAPLQAPGREGGEQVGPREHTDRRIPRVLAQDGKILLVRELQDGGRWTLPGGWADPGDTPSQAVLREIREESGYEARALGPSHGTLRMDGSRGVWEQHGVNGQTRPLMGDIQQIE